MNEDQAYAAFLRMRWPETGGLPVCPKCGDDGYYEIKTRRKFKCKACRSQYSATSGTIFHARKLSYRDIVSAANTAADYRVASKLGLAKSLDVQWRTADILSDKINAALDGESFPTRSTVWRKRLRLRRPRMDYWPYLAEGQKEAGVDLLMQIHALIPKGIPDHLRADMCQELCVAFLSGEFDTAKPDKKVVAKAKRRVYDMHDMVYKTVSIDAPIHPASTTTIADFLAADAMDKWAA